MNTQLTISDQSITSALIDAIRKPYTEYVEKCLTDTTTCFYKKFEEVFFQRIDDIVNISIKECFSTNKQINELIKKQIEQYITNINFEQTVLELFNSKKELIMDQLIKKMFLDKKTKKKSD